LFGTVVTLIGTIRADHGIAGAGKDPSRARRDIGSRDRHWIYWPGADTGAFFRGNHWGGLWTYSMALFVIAGSRRMT